MKRSSSSIAPTSIPLDQRINAFLTDQRARSDRKTTLHTWMLTYQSLDEESRRIEAELVGTMEAMAAQSRHEDNQVVASEASSTLRTMLSEHATFHQATRSNVRGLMFAARAYRLHRQLAPSTSPKDLYEQVQFARIESQCAATKCIKEVDAMMQNIDLSKIGLRNESTFSSLLRSVAKDANTTGNSLLTPLPEPRGQDDDHDDDDDDDDDSFHRNEESALDASYQDAQVESDAANPDLEDLLGGYRTIKDDEILNSIRLAYATLQKRFRTRYASWREEYQGAERDAGCRGARGTWSLEDHEAYMHWRQQVLLATHGGVSLSRAEALRRVAVLFPNKTYSEILDHEHWVTSDKLLRERGRALQEAWERSRNDFFTSSRTLLAQCLEETAIKMERVAMAAATHARQQELHATLETHRQAKAVKAEAMQKALRDAATTKKTRLTAEAAKQREAAQHRAAMLASYHAALAARAREEEMREAALARRQEEERRERAAINEVRVAHRQSLAEAKRLEVEKQRAERGRLEREREARLEELRATVAIEVESDPERARGPTASWLAAPADAATAEGVASFGAVAGYRDEELMRDPRFRLQTYLAEKGVMKQPEAQAYAREMIAVTKSNKLTRADNLTTNQLESLAGGKNIF